jgi:hypothetical protein
VKLNRLTAAILFAAGVSVIAGTIVLVSLNDPETPIARTVLHQASDAALVVIGAVLLWFRPENRMSKLFALIAFLIPLTEFLEHYAEYAFGPSGRPLPMASLATWLAGWIWVPAYGSLGLLLLLWFPTGRVPSRVWLPVQVFDLALLTVFSFYVAFAQDPHSNAAHENPLAIPAVSATADAVFAVIEPLFPFLVLLSVASLVARYRNAREIERLQLKWFLTASAVFLSYVALQTMGVVGGLLEAMLEVTAFLGLPLAVAAAILRYRLYDIDVIINRALVYGALTAVLVALYAGGVLVFRALLDPITGDNDLAVAASTLAVAAMFRPARRRIQSFIDRRFYRSRYDAQKTLERFLAHARDEVDVRALSREVVTVLANTVGPAHASVWLTQEDSR